MKKTLMLLFAFISINAYSFVPSINVCDDGSGQATVDINVQTPVLLGTNSPSDYTVNYYTSMADATADVNAIPNTSNYTIFGSAIIYARIEENASGNYTLDFFDIVMNNPIATELPDVASCGYYTLEVLQPNENYYTGPGGTGTIIPAGTSITTTQTIYIFKSIATCTDETSFNVTVMPIPSPLLQDGVVCKEFNSGVTISAYTLNTGYPVAGYTFTWQLNGMLIPGETSNSLVATEPGEYEVTVQSATNPSCSGSATAQVILSGPAAVIGFNGYIVDGQTITALVQGYGDYQFQLDDGPTNSSGVFQNAGMGMHILHVYDSNGCGTLSISNIFVSVPSPPEGMPTQTFTEGQTLADIVVNGQNIQWYANDAEVGRHIFEAPLPMSTPLVNETTYYASQTINGVESTSRLPVTVTLALGLNEQVFQNLTYLPNPVVNTFLVSNIFTIDNIRIVNLQGQIVLSKTLGSMQAELDLSSFTGGVYFVSVTSGNAIKTIKIIKK